MGTGFKVGGSSVFKSTLTVQANPSATITAASTGATYTAVADGYGIATFTIKKKGTYTLTTSNTASYDAEGNTPTVAVLRSNSSYEGQLVKINIPASLSVGKYGSNILTAYFARPASAWSGVNLRYNTGSAPASRTSGYDVATGAGNSIALNSSSTVNGYNHSGLSAGVTYYYSIFSYLTINGEEYWATTYRSGSAAASNYVGQSAVINATGTWYVPEGWRSVRAFLVGGGGGGGYGGSNNGGGGGGYTNTSGAIAVTPGEGITVLVGAGGAGGTEATPLGGGGGMTWFGSSVYASGGYGSQNTFISGSGYTSGGSGGSGGGGRAMTESGSSLQRGGGAGGSNGGNGANVQYASSRYYFGGNGQGYTTGAWGNASNTIYAGGGGGGGHVNYAGGAGGLGGGGTGGGSYSAGGNGTANTGGGGGGGWHGSGATYYNGGAGGSGIILVECAA